LIDVVYESDSIFHSTYCAANKFCIHPKSPKPCYTKLPNNQGFAISFEGILENKPWTIRTGEVIVPNHRGEYSLPWCAANIIDPQHFLFLRLHSAYKEGHLLFEGGLADQPAIVIEAIGIIESEIARVTERKQKKQEMKQGKRG